MMAFFTIKKRDSEAMFICLIIVFSIIFTVISYEEVYDLSKIESETDQHRVFNEEAFMKWK